MQKSQRARELVVSLHDVSVRTRLRSAEILRDLECAGIRAVTLLVVPDHHREGLVSEDREFAGWLRSECALGREAALHGYYHIREKRAADGPWKRLVTGIYTAGEGEFFDMEENEARERLERGREAVRACGLECTGFVAPAWLLGANAERAVREAGFEYTTRIATVSDFRAGAIHRSRSLVWSVRAPWRRACSLAWNAALFAGTSHGRLLRVGIHPPDWDHPQIRRQILAFVREAASAREAMTYQGWLQLRRGGFL